MESPIQHDAATSDSSPRVLSPPQQRKSSVRRWLSRTAFGLAAIVSIAVMGTLLARRIEQGRIASETEITSPEGVSSLEQVRLGGREQSILVRGHSRHNPVLLFLHGGPGSPVMYKSRLFGTELEKHFIVVHWDQRGAGKYYRANISPSEMTIEQFEHDTVELINKLRQRFSKDRIYLVGHSWGAILGARVAQKRPDLLWAYVAAGQPVNIRRNEQISYNFAITKAREAGDKDEIAALSKIKPMYKSIDELLTQRRILQKYLRHKKADHVGGGRRSGLVYLLTAPEYSLIDVWRTRAGAPWTLEAMWDELKEVDLMNQVPCIDVPVYFFTGRYDLQVPFELVEEWFARLKAPYKEMVWFENSAHEMYMDEPGRFQQVLIDEVLPETYRQSRPPVCRVD